jgi:hypothetical protein
MMVKSFNESLQAANDWQQVGGEGGRSAWEAAALKVVADNSVYNIYKSQAAEPDRWRLLNE